MTKKWGNTQSKLGVALPEKINSRGREILGLLRNVRIHRRVYKILRQAG